MKNLGNEMEQTDLAVTGAERVLSQKMRVALLAHFQNAVPIEHLGLTDTQKDMLARVEHVYWMYLKNPFLDTRAMFYELAKQRYKNGGTTGRGNAYNVAKIEEHVFAFVVENMKPPSRKDRENKVRFAADTLMKRGFETGDNRALAKGAEIGIKLDKLDQPETEQQDISKVAFLPSVVVTNIEQIDPDKTYIDDEETRRIAAKYGAHIPEQRTMIEEQVATMEARAGAAELMAPEPPTPRNTFGTIYPAEDSEPNDESDDE